MAFHRRRWIRRIDLTINARCCHARADGPCGVWPRAAQRDEPRDLPRIARRRRVGDVHARGLDADSKEQATQLEKIGSRNQTLTYRLNFHPWLL
ncbi:MAG: hypothetical protein HC800_23755 [Phormidesmis sp. RL_2_1]|nr:hypothetical protein [Phormidesmis sp. RL_2_1]